MSQKQSIAKYLKKRPRQWIGLWELFHASLSMRVSARIHDLRKTGMDIECRVKQVGYQRYSKYRYNP